MLLILNSNLARYFFTKSDQHRGQNGIRIAVPHCPRRLRKFHFSFRGFLFQNSFYIGGKRHASTHMGVSGLNTTVRQDFIEYICTDIMDEFHCLM